MIEQHFGIVLSFVALAGSTIYLVTAPNKWHALAGVVLMFVSITILSYTLEQIK